MILGNEIAEIVEEYVYLGQALRMDNDLKGELQRRRRAGWIQFTKMREIFSDPSIRQSLKTEIFNRDVLPVLLYGCETWNTTLAEEKLMVVTQQSMERRITEVSRLQHMTNEEVRRSSGVRDIVETMYARKRSWAGHVARLSDNRWTKRIAEWYPRDIKRPRGRPPRRWSDPLRKIFGVTWIRSAQNRKFFKRCRLDSWRQ